MKKIMFLIVVIVMIGCGDRQILHTYYGDFDTDTMEVAFTRGNQLWYKVRYSERDSFMMDGKLLFVKGPVIDYYCPSTNTYEETFLDNQGNIISVEIDPYHKMDWLNE